MNLTLRCCLATISMWSKTVAESTSSRSKLASVSLPSSAPASASSNRNSRSSMENTSSRCPVCIAPLYSYYTSKPPVTLDGNLTKLLYNKLRYKKGTPSRRSLNPCVLSWCAFFASVPLPEMSADALSLKLTRPHPTGELVPDTLLPRAGNKRIRSGLITTNSPHLDRICYCQVSQPMPGFPNTRSRRESNPRLITLEATAQPLSTKSLRQPCPY